MWDDAPGEQEDEMKKKGCFVIIVLTVSVMALIAFMILGKIGGWYYYDPLIEVSKTL